MKENKRMSKSRRNYYVDIATLLPFLLLIFTGIIMLIYHTGKPYSEFVLVGDGDSWLNFHKVSAVITLVMITIHLGLHLNWFEKLFSGNLKNKYWIRNLILFILFLVTSLTSIIPWLFLDDSNAESMMLGIHNKIGLLMIVFFFIHVFSYFGWLKNMTKKVFA